MDDESAYAEQNEQGRSAMVTTMEMACVRNRVDSIGTSRDLLCSRRWLKRLGSNECHSDSRRNRPGECRSRSSARHRRITSRFQTLGLHPKLLTRLQSQSSPHIAPGSYDVMQYDPFSSKSIQKSTQGPSWRQALYTEQMARIPHSSFKETYEKRKENERRLGPGTYSINDFLTNPQRRPNVARGILDQLSPRFPEDHAVRIIRQFLALIDVRLVT